MIFFDEIATELPTTDESKFISLVSFLCSLVPHLFSLLAEGRVWSTNWLLAALGVLRDDHYPSFNVIKWQSDW